MSFIFNHTTTPDIYTLSLHDALPISQSYDLTVKTDNANNNPRLIVQAYPQEAPPSSTPTLQRDERSEEHTSELQSHSDLVCRLLLEKKKNENNKTNTQTYRQTLMSNI